MATGELGEYEWKCQKDITECDGFIQASCARFGPGQLWPSDSDQPITGGVQRYQGDAHQWTTSTLELLRRRNVGTCQYFPISLPLSRYLQLSTGELSRGVFNHCTITSTIQDAVWTQSDKFSKLIPEGTNNIDCLLAFAATIVWWVLKALRRGPESDFEVAIYGPHYEAAMGRIADIRSLDPSDARLECLNTITSQLLQRGKHLVEFRQVVLD